MLEEGIENVENLAHADLVDLRLYTRIPLSRIVDLFDQAILYLHLGGDNIDQLRYTRLYLRQQGIRTATDLKRAYDKTQNKPAFLEMVAAAYEYTLGSTMGVYRWVGRWIARDQSDGQVNAPANQGGPPENTQPPKGTQGGQFRPNPFYKNNRNQIIKRFQVILDAMDDDIWLWHLECWCNPSHDYQTVDSPDHFYDTQSQVCARCSKSNPVENNFCYNCGCGLLGNVVSAKFQADDLFNKHNYSVLGLCHSELARNLLLKIRPACQKS